MSAAANLMNFIWPAVSLLGGVLQVGAALALLRKSPGPGPWLMLGGGGVAMICQMATHLIFSFQLGRAYSVIYQVGSAISMLGGLAWLAFCAGLLVHALTLRAPEHR